MILFSKDTETQACFYDLNTKNRSFVKMAVVLKKMGVKNNKFMLATTQRELLGVDPHDPNISPDLQDRIAYEVKTNPWYFFREVLRVPTGGTDAVPYKLNRANMALIWCFLACIPTYLTMPRQVGKTIGVCGLNAYMQYIMGKKLNIGLFAKGNQLREENVSRIKDLRDTIPDWLYMKGPKYNTDNQEGLVYKKNKTAYITFVALGDKKNAAAQGRGQSHAYQHWDEFAFYTNNDLSYPAAKIATNTAGAQVRAAGIPCANMITTTAGDLSTNVGQFAYDIKAACMPFTEMLYDAVDKAELKMLVDNSCKQGMLYLEFDHEQLGKDQAWFEEVTRGLPVDVVDRDYRNIWSHGSSGSILPVDLLRVLKNNAIEPLHTGFINEMFVRYYAVENIVNSEEFKQTPFLIGSDTSDNVGKDSTTVCMTDPKDLAVNATIQCNSANLAFVAKTVCEILKLYPNSIYIPERNKNGAVMIDFVLEHFENDPSFDPFKRIFNHFNQEAATGYVDKNSIDLRDGRDRKKFGFNTSVGSRKLLYTSILSTAVRQCAEKIFDKTLTGEICGLTVRNGRVDHSEGQHDDMLISWLLTCYFVMYGKNHRLYGLTSADILSNMDDQSEDTDPLIKQQQEVYRRRYDSIARTIDQVRSPIIKEALEREMRELKSMMGDQTSKNVISIHQVKENSVKEREAVSHTPQVYNAATILKQLNTW